MFGPLIDLVEQCLVEPHRNHAAGAIPARLAAAFAQHLDVVPGFGLVSPSRDLLVSNRLSVDPLVGLPDLPRAARPGRVSHSQFPPPAVLAESLA